MPIRRTFRRRAFADAGEALACAVCCRPALPPLTALPLALRLPVLLPLAVLPLAALPLTLAGAVLLLAGLALTAAAFRALTVLGCGGVAFEADGRLAVGGIATGSLLTYATGRTNS